MKSFACLGVLAMATGLWACSHATTSPTGPGGGGSGGSTSGSGATSSGATGPGGAGGIGGTGGVIFADSDGDGIPDDAEGKDAPGGPVDSDGDGIPDYLDTDSDN